MLSCQVMRIDVVSSETELFVTSGWGPASEWPVSPQPWPEHVMSCSWHLGIDVFWQFWDGVVPGSEPGPREFTVDRFSFTKFQLRYAIIATVEVVVGGSVKGPGSVN